MLSGRGQRLWTSGSSQRAARHWEGSDKHTKASKSACTQRSGGKYLGKPAGMVTLHSAACLALATTEMQPALGWAWTPAVPGAVLGCGGRQEPREPNVVDRPNVAFAIQTSAAPVLRMSGRAAGAKRAQSTAMPGISVVLAPAR